MFVQHIVPDSSILIASLCVGTFALVFWVALVCKHFRAGAGLSELRPSDNALRLATG